MAQETTTLEAKVDRLLEMMEAERKRREALEELVQELSHLSRPVCWRMVEVFDDLERRSYFGFAREGLYVLDRIVTEFSEEDVRALGDHIVTILTTVRNMTQPEVLALANRALDTLRTEETDGRDLSTLALLRQLSDPEVKRGLARLIRVVTVLAEAPSAEEVASHPVTHEGGSR